MNDYTVSFAHLSKCTHKQIGIFICFKYIPVLVSSAHHMVTCARIFNSEWSGHSEYIPLSYYNANPFLKFIGPFSLRGRQLFVRRRTQVLLSFQGLIERYGMKAPSAYKAAKWNSSDVSDLGLEPFVELKLNALLSSTVFLRTYSSCCLNTSYSVLAQSEHASAPSIMHSASFASRSAGTHVK